MLRSSWTRIIEYPENHLNDFCLFQGFDARWHCLGIMGTGTWASETSLFHCSSERLFGPYQIHDPLLVDLEQGLTGNSAPQKHAPFVVVRDKMYFLFFRRPPGTNLLLKSDDVFRWPREPTVMFEENDARDACIQEFGNTYYWYYCQWNMVGRTGRSCIRLRCSDDLENWSAPLDVHVDTTREVRHSHLESPFVVEADGRYWLLVRDRSQDQDCATTVFVSNTPASFPSGKQAWTDRLANVHAPEIVRCRGKWCLARVSGPPDHLPYAPRQGGWIDLAEISFANGDADSAALAGDSAALQPRQ